MRQVQYAYYDGTQANGGNLGDLMTATVLDAGNNVLATCPYQKCHSGSRTADSGGEAGNAAPENSGRRGEKRSPHRVPPGEAGNSEAVLALQSEQARHPDKEGERRGRHE